MKSEANELLRGWKEQIRFGILQQKFYSNTCKKNWSSCYSKDESYLKQITSTMTIVLVNRTHCPKSSESLSWIQPPARKHSLLTIFIDIFKLLNDVHMRMTNQQITVIYYKRHILKIIVNFITWYQYFGFFIGLKQCTEDALRIISFALKSLIF